MKKNKIKIVLLIILVIGIGLFSACKKEENKETKPISILCTSDVHTGYKENIGYAGLKAYQKARISEGYDTALIDTGDFVQGDLICSITEGLFNVDLLNKMGYSSFTIGNHEFDYGMDALKEMISLFEGDVLSANLKYLGNEDNKIKDVKQYTILSFDNIKIAIVGITTPQSLTDGNPNNFKENDKTVYSFLDIATSAQNAIDDARSEGASFVIIASHLGSSDVYAPNSSIDLVKNIQGVDAIIDGHAHIEIEKQLIKTKDNKEIPLICLGTKLSAFAEIIIKDGKLNTNFIKEYEEKDEEIASYIEMSEKLFASETEKIVAKINMSLSMYDNDGIRLTRTRETQIADLCADALREISDSQIAFINGGGVRDSINAGDISFADIFKINPFGDEVVKAKIKGQDIIDYLEYASRFTMYDYQKDGKAIGENGGFAQVSGLKYTIDTNIESTCIADDAGNFIRVDGARRVKDVLVLNDDNYVAIDPNKYYEVAMSDFMLAGGDGMSMLKNGEIISSYGAVHEVLINYIVYNLKGDLSKYSSLDGRIIIE